MTYVQRRNEERKERSEKAKEEPQWRKAEERVRKALGFFEDRHSKALGIDGVRVKESWFYDRQEISHDEAEKIEREMELKEAQMDEERDMVADHIDSIVQQVVGSVLRTPLTETELHTQLLDEFIFEASVWSWLDDLLPFEKLKRPKTKEYVTFLEVKNWVLGKVSSDAIDTFVGKMIRGGADEGVFVASKFTKRVTQTITDYNFELSKIDKKLIIRKLSNIINIWPRTPPEAL